MLIVLNSHEGGRYAKLQFGSNALISQYNSLCIDYSIVQCIL